MKAGNKALGEAFDDIWRHCGTRMMMVVKLMLLQVFDTPYAICSQKVPYVLRAALLLDTDMPREPSLWRVFLDRTLSNLRFMRCASLLGRDKNFVTEARSKFGLYCGLEDFSTVPGLALSTRSSFWTTKMRVTGSFDAHQVCNAA